MSEPSLPKATLAPKKIRTAVNDIIYAARHRHRPCSPGRPHHRGRRISTPYELAKAAETSERDLPRAALLYAEAARKGEKVDSCIKDFASIMHQMGETEAAVKFLQEARPSYQGDLSKYDRLLTTLERQLEPSGKHHCKNLLLELPAPEEPSPSLLASLFANVTRVKAVRAYSHLDFEREPEERGKWLVLEFESFSAAKKTLEKFAYEEWFGVNRFWMREGLVVCLATDGREDFERGLVLGEEALRRRLGKSLEWLLEGSGGEQLQRMNRLSIGVIEREEEWGGSSDSDN